MREEILEILKEIRPEADYASSENFVDDGLLDSLEMMNLLDALEAQFDIYIDGKYYYYPASGYRNDFGGVSEVGSVGRYWTFCSQADNSILFESDSEHPYNFYYTRKNGIRSYGSSVRCQKL